MMTRLCGDCVEMRFDFVSDVEQLSHIRNAMQCGVKWIQTLKRQLNDERAQSLTLDIYTDRRWSQKHNVTYVE